MDALTTCDEAFDQMNCATIAVETHVFEWQQETLRAAEALQSLAAGLGAIPGRKMIIYGSEGFLRDPGSVATNAIIAEFGTDKVNWSSTRSRLRRDLSVDLLKLFRTAASAGTAFFPIDVRSIADRDWVSDASQEFQLHERQLFNPMADIFDATRNTLSSLADATGGRAYFGADAASRISEAISSSRGLYTVGYYAPFEIDRSRDIKVKIKRKNVRVSDPSGAAPGVPPRPLATEVALFKPVPGGDHYAVPVALELNLADVPLERGENDTWNVQLSVYAALLDGSGKVAGESFEVVDVSLNSEQYRQRRSRPFRHVLRVEVPAGRYRTRVRVTDQKLRVKADRLLPDEMDVGHAAPAVTGD
jgi:hypothetical protein